METNKIYKEDCLNTMSRMPDGFIDLTVTSPPYDGLRTYVGNIDKTFTEKVWKKILKDLYRVTKPGGIVVWIVGDQTKSGSETCTSFKQALFGVKCGFKLYDTMVYNRASAYPSNVRYSQDFEYMFIFSKGKPSTFNPLKDKKSSKTIQRQKHRYLANKKHRAKDGYMHRTSDNGKRRMNDARNSDEKIMSNVWYVPAGNMISTKDKIAFKHPAIFPEKLCAMHILSWSNENELVYDPFMGSGTTAKMARYHNRNFIGSEINPEYVQGIANRRISQKTLF